MGNKEIATEIYTKHLALASADGRGFRKSVMDEIMARTGCSLAASATYYNNCKKAGPVIQGLGRAPTPKGVRKMGGAKAKKEEDLVPDEECFAVMELVKNDGSFTVGRYQSFILQGDASEKFDDKIEAWPNSHWVMIQGLGPNSGDNFKLDTGEKEIKRYSPKVSA